MRKFLIFCTLLLASISLLAQSSPQLVSEVHYTTAKPGMVTQWENGRKQHSAFHAAQKDTWSILVWQILTGPRTGGYIMASPGHNWKDLDARDAFNKLDIPDVAKNMEPYTATTDTAYFVYRDDLSMTKPPATPAKMRTTTTYMVIPEHVNDFIDAVKKINAAIQKTNYPVKPSPGISWRMAAICPCLSWSAIALPGPTWNRRKRNSKTPLRRPMAMPVRWNNCGAVATVSSRRRPSSARI
jgi:hypothetical protein